MFIHLYYVKVPWSNKYPSDKYLGFFTWQKPDVRALIYMLTKYNKPQKPYGASW